MFNVSPGDLQVQMRPARPDDQPFVKHLSGEVFNVFGEYGDFLPKYLEHPDVMTTITETNGQAAGFTMLALVISETPLPWQERSVPLEEEMESERTPPIWVDAELVAIAVAPPWQSQGIGRRQLDFIIDFVESRTRTRGVRSVQLNVADTNLKALTFFKKMGFQVVSEEDGRYPRGQRSIRMARRTG